MGGDVLKGHAWVDEGRGRGGAPGRGPRFGFGFPLDWVGLTLARRVKADRTPGDLSPAEGGAQLCQSFGLEKPP